MILWRFLAIFHRSRRIALVFELDDFAACLNAGRAPQRLTPADSRLAVEIGIEELRQLGGSV